MDNTQLINLATKTADIFIKNTTETIFRRIDNKERTASVQQRTTNEQHRTAEETSKDKLIKVLEEQLEEANKSRANLEKLLDQQQQLTLISNKKIESLKLQIEENKDSSTTKNKWWHFFK